MSPEIEKQLKLINQIASKKGLTVELSPDEQHLIWKSGNEVVCTTPVEDLFHISEED